MQVDYFTTKDGYKTAKVQDCNEYVFVDAEIPKVIDTLSFSVINGRVSLQSTTKILPSKRGSNLSSVDLTSRNYKSEAIYPKLGYKFNKDGFSTSQRYSLKSVPVENELEACKLAAEIDKKLSDKSFDFKSCRWNEDDLVNLYLKGVVSYEEATLKHIRRFSNNAWFVYRYDLIDYFKENNIPIPSYELDNEGFMIDPMTGRFLCPAKENSLTSWYLSSKNSNLSGVDDLITIPVRDSNEKAFHTKFDNFYLVNRAYYNELSFSYRHKKDYSDLVDALMLKDYLSGMTEDDIIRKYDIYFCDVASKRNEIRGSYQFLLTNYAGTIFNDEDSVKLFSLLEEKERKEQEYKDVFKKYQE